MNNVISVENLSKSYRLGQIGTGTFAHDLSIWWAKMRGKPNPMLKIGEKDHNRDGEELWALKDVSFKVEQGEVLGIIGRNGAGKSTLLKILSRVTAPTSGRVKVKGRIASLLEVGTGFHPELTGRENIYLNGAILGMSKAEVTRKFDEIVDFAEVEKFTDTPVKRYSSGMYVRLAFAVAAHLEPEILIIDEVLAVGDAEFQKKCLGKMGDVAKEGRTVLFVSHNMGAINSLCTQTLVIHQGNILFYGDTNEGVLFYLSESEKANNLSWQWSLQNAPGGDNAKIAYVIIHNGSKDKKALTTSDEIHISIGFWNLNDDKEVWAGLNILDNTGGIIASCINLTSSAKGTDTFRGKKLKKGLYESTIKVPRNFFNDHSYGFLPYLQTSLMLVESMPESPFFVSILDSGEMRKEYTAFWQGILRPKMEWTTVKIDE